MPPSNIAYTDFPLFRLSEIYLNYAEAVLRGGSGGSRTTALELINELRGRAYKQAPYTISDGELTLISSLPKEAENFSLKDSAAQILFVLINLQALLMYGPGKGT